MRPRSVDQHHRRRRTFEGPFKDIKIGSIPPLEYPPAPPFVLTDRKKLMWHSAASSVSFSMDNVASPSRSAGRGGCRSSRGGVLAVIDYEYSVSVSTNRAKQQPLVCLRAEQHPYAAGRCCVRARGERQRRVPQFHCIFLGRSKEKMVPDITVGSGKHGDDRFLHPHRGACRGRCACCISVRRSVERCHKPAVLCYLLKNEGRSAKTTMSFCDGVPHDVVQCRHRGEEEVSPLGAFPARQLPHLKF